jgi:prevent-host-death family protein
MTNSAGPLMRRISVAAAKAQFSAVLAQAEAGEELMITRRGVAIARIVAEPTRPADGFDLQELCQFTDTQPMREGADAGTFMAELRRDVRY